MQYNFFKFFSALEHHQIALFIASKRVADRLHGVRESDGWQNHFFGIRLRASRLRRDIGDIISHGPIFQPPSGS
jgi:hypothetical protein